MQTSAWAVVGLDLIGHGAECYRAERAAEYPIRQGTRRLRYSHSIVAGGFELMS